MSETTATPKDPSGSNDETFWQFLKSRVSHQFLSWYICSWVLWNWEIFAILSGSTHPIGYRIGWVKELLYGADAGGRWEFWTIVVSFGAPLIAAIFLKPLADFFVIVRRLPEKIVRRIDESVLRWENSGSWITSKLLSFRLSRSSPYLALKKERDDLAKERNHLAAKLREKSTQMENAQNLLVKFDGDRRGALEDNEILLALAQRMGEMATEGRKALAEAIKVAGEIGGSRGDSLVRPLHVIAQQLEAIKIERELYLFRHAPSPQPPPPTHPESSPAPTTPPDQA